MLKITPSFLQPKFSSGAKIISNLKQSLLRNFPCKVFNNQFELIQGFGSLITGFLFCNIPKLKVQWISVRAFWGPRKVGLVADNSALELVLQIREDFLFFSQNFHYLAIYSLLQIKETPNIAEYTGTSEFARLIGYPVVKNYCPPCENSAYLNQCICGSINKIITNRGDF